MPLFLAFASPMVALASPPAPRILIVPVRKNASDAAPSPSIGNFLAQEFDQEGRVRPVVWSASDPTFRDLMANGVLKISKQYPTRTEALSAAKSVGAQYVFLYSAAGTSKGMTATGSLYERGREIWHDAQNSSTQRSGQVSEDSTASIAHTWNLEMDGAAFRLLARHPKVVTPNASTGQSPPPVAAVETPPVVKSVDLVQKTAELVKNGHADKALGLVRDAIDSQPFDPRLRLLLVSLFEAQRDWSAAADAARTGSEVIPDDLQLRRANLKNLLQAGRDREARDEMKELIARTPTSVTTLLLDAETLLMVGEYEQATLDLDRLAKLSPSTSCYYWRAIARATLGGADGVDADIREYLKSPLTPSEQSAACAAGEQILLKATAKDIALALDLFRRVQLHPDDQLTKDRYTSLLNDATARANFVQQVPPALSNKSSYGQLLLAQKLLIASFASLRDMMRGGSEDTLTDARINLGEAIKAMKNAQSLLETEQGKDDVGKFAVDVH